LLSIDASIVGLNEIIVDRPHSSACIGARRTRRWRSQSCALLRRLVVAAVPALVYAYCRHLC
jgi:hypothetical protein